MKSELPRNILVSDLVPEINALWKLNTTYFTNIHLVYINRKDLKQQILMLIH